MSLNPLLQGPTTDPAAIYRYRDGLYAADMLTAALVELDFFSRIGTRPRSLADICAQFDFQPRPVDVMTTLFVAMGLLERVGPRLQLTRRAREHLVTGSPWCLRSYFPKLADRPIAQDLLAVLRTGQPTRFAGRKQTQDWHRAMAQRAFAEEFTAAMDCRGLYLAQLLARRVSLRRHRRLLDIGGGSGVYACALASKCPRLTAVVLEQAPVDRVARSYIRRRGCAARVEVVAGDMFNDPLPRDCDVHLYSNVLHDWDEADVRRLLARSAEALPVGGRLIVHEAFLNQNKTGPLAMAEYSVLLMHVTKGRCYSTRELGGWLRQLGFRIEALVPTAAGRQALIART